MTMTLKVDKQVPINFGATGEEAIIQNVCTIVSTLQYTVPLSRSMGVDGTAIDRPQEVAKALYAASVIAAVSQSEPRARVVQVDFDMGEGQTLIPILRIEIIPEGEEVMG